MPKNDTNDYVIQVLDSPLALPAAAWDDLLARQTQPTPFMRHAYLAALHTSGCASPATGWTARFITLWCGEQLAAACPLYLKSHSRGEYVFDWAWANAYAQHGLHYYPKAIVAVPFTPVPGTRLLAQDAAARAALVKAVLDWCQETQVSSLHLLFAADDDLAACQQAGLIQRDTVQFHWQRPPALNADATFDDFLATLNQEKRKKIRQERRKVHDAGVTFRWTRGAAISAADWTLFERCYERTYLEHGNHPYLNHAFFTRMARDMPDNWLLFIAERAGQPIAASLIAVQGDVAYGRYWGALERVDCLHFEACYYQPLQWCMTHGIQRFEGGAQGEHKMARALLPVKTSSAHWLAHPAFADAVERFLAREGEGIGEYLAQLEARSPLRKA